MPSVTSWSRIEPAPPGNDVAAGLAARTADALWLLARQWQVGEFQAEDGGTPIVARWRGHVTGPDALRVRRDPARHPAPGAALRRRGRAARGDRRAPAVPLPTLPPGRRPGCGSASTPAATSSACSPPSPTAQDYGPAFRTTFAVPRSPTPTPPGWTRPPSATTASSPAAPSTAAGCGPRRRPPGHGLADVGTPIAAGDLAEVRAACAAWIAWVDELFSQPGADEQAWQRDRMEYAVSFATRTSPDRFDEWTLTADQLRRRRARLVQLRPPRRRQRRHRRRPRPTPARWWCGRRCRRR